MCSKNINKYIVHRFKGGIRGNVYASSCLQVCVACAYLCKFISVDLKRNIINTPYKKERRCPCNQTCLATHPAELRYKLKKHLYWATHIQKVHIQKHPEHCKTKKEIRKCTQWVASLQVNTPQHTCRQFYVMIEDYYSISLEI